MAKMSRMARMEIMRNGRTQGNQYGENRFRDRRGREHYDNGRFAPMNDTNIEIEGRFRDDRGGERFQAGYGDPMNYDGRMDTMERRGGRMDYGGMNGGQMRGNQYGENRYPYGPFPVYQERNGMRGGGYEMNQIGFNANREMDSNGYRMNAGYEMQNEMEHRPGQRMAGGHASGNSWERMEPMTKEKAEQWVRSMKGAAGGPGQHWNMDQAKQIMTRHGFQDDPVEFYVVLNMMKSDYTKAAQKMGVDKEEFYACMADAFLNDEDAQDDKLTRYYECIAKK